MNPKATIKILILAASALSPLIAAKITSAIAPAFAKMFADLLGGRPLPILTDVLVLKFAGTNASLAVGLMLTVLILISVATVANPKRPANESAQTLQLALAFAGPFLATIYLGVFLLAALLPLLAVPTSIGR